MFHMGSLEVGSFVRLFMENENKIKIRNESGFGNSEMLKSIEDYTNQANELRDYVAKSNEEIDISIKELEDPIKELREKRQELEGMPGDLRNNLSLTIPDFYTNNVNTSNVQSLYDGTAELFRNVVYPTKDFEFLDEKANFSEEVIQDLILGANKINLEGILSDGGTPFGKYKGYWYRIHPFIEKYESEIDNSSGSKRRFDSLDVFKGRIPLLNSTSNDLAGFMEYENRLRRWDDNGWLTRGEGLKKIQISENFVLTENNSYACDRTEGGDEEFDEYHYSINDIPISKKVYQKFLDLSLDVKYVPRDNEFSSGEG